MGPIDDRGEAARRPTLGAFLWRVGCLTNEEAREVAELPRVTDWRHERDIWMLLGGQEGVAQLAASRRRAALREARQILGRSGIDATRRQAAEVLARLRPTWPGMRLHRPLRWLGWAGIPVFIVGGSLLPSAAGPPQVALLIFVLLLSVSPAVAQYLLPPSPKDLQSVVEAAALAHAAGPALGETHFAELTDGWEAVLAGRWRRGPRPYRAWAWPPAAVVGLVLLGLAVDATGVRA